MVVSNSSPAKSVREFVDFAKSNRGRLTFGSSGNGTVGHLCGELFKRSSAIEMTHVPYRGGGPALNDLIPGRIDVMFATLPSVLPQIQGGTIRPLAVTSAARVPFAANLPTIAESGVPGFDVTEWHALFMPAKTPGEIIKKVHSDTVEALASPSVKQKFEELAIAGVNSTPEELSLFLRSEMEKWSLVIKEANINPE
jgi:tripartite-type tricarboxylate transporter receptor subunit TctC